VFPDFTSRRAAQDRILDVLDAATDWSLDVLDAIGGRRRVVRVRVIGPDGTATYVQVGELGASSLTMRLVELAPLYGVYGPRETAAMETRRPARREAGPSCYLAWIRAAAAGDCSAELTRPPLPARGLTWLCRHLVDRCDCPLTLLAFPMRKVVFARSLPRKRAPSGSGSGRGLKRRLVPCGGDDYRVVSRRREMG